MKTNVLHLARRVYVALIIRTSRTSGMHPKWTFWMAVVGLLANSTVSCAPTNGGSPTGTDAPLPQTYVIRWTDYHPVAEHANLLTIAWTSGVSQMTLTDVARKEGVEAGRRIFETSSTTTVKSHSSAASERCEQRAGDNEPTKFLGTSQDGVQTRCTPNEHTLYGARDIPWILVDGDNDATKKFLSDISLIRLSPAPQARSGGHGLDAETVLEGHVRDLHCKNLRTRERSTGVCASKSLVEALQASPLVRDLFLDENFTEHRNSHGAVFGGCCADAQDIRPLQCDMYQRVDIGSNCEASGNIYSLARELNVVDERHDVGSSKPRHTRDLPENMVKGRFGGDVEIVDTISRLGRVTSSRTVDDVVEARNTGSRQRQGGILGRERLRGNRRHFVEAGSQGKFLHESGFRGGGVKVAVFDTGLDPGMHDFDHLVEVINWTDEDTVEDPVGHGTHVAGVIAGRDTKCSGLAPDAEIYVFRVFSSEQVSYTSWFLDALNYAMFVGVDVINLSVGGPDYRDMPFVDKIREVSANGIIVVSAVGNDGPLYGTLHNPADQMDTIGVGALASSGKEIADFQSRGMSTAEIEDGGYGRVKPDIVAVGEHVLGPKAGGTVGQCSSLSGTSVASPVVAGAVALLASTVPVKLRQNIVNPASMKQVLVESAARLAGANIYEQGAGALDIQRASELLNKYTPRASLIPDRLDFTDPYMWPHSRQPLFFGALPLVANVTIVNGMGVTGKVTSVLWNEDKDGFTRGAGQNLIDISAQHSDVLWPWSGYLALSLTISEHGRNYNSIVRGKLQVVIESEKGPGETSTRVSEISLPIVVRVQPPPPREKRLLWDQYHNIPYPSPYVPRDNLGDHRDMLDRRGDHLHTNFKSLFERLVSSGYYIDILMSDWTCFDAAQYGALLLVDLEDELAQDEVSKLTVDVREKGLSVVVFADWYDQDVMNQIRFIDDNTRVQWQPITGGANLPALNSFLSSFQISFADEALDGTLDLQGGHIHFASGNAIASVPSAAEILLTSFLGEASVETGSSSKSPDEVDRIDIVIAALDVNRLRGEAGSSGQDSGRLFVFGDSSCVDDSFLDSPDAEGNDCLWLFGSAVKYACEGYRDPLVFDVFQMAGDLDPDYTEMVHEEGVLRAGTDPQRFRTNELWKYSKTWRRTHSVNLPLFGSEGMQHQCDRSRWWPVRSLS